MSIPDGEYDLDLSILTQLQHLSSSVGLRYQFVPPTVDRSRPVKVYEQGRECILEVPLTEGSKSILFEGSVAHTALEPHNVGAQTYYLSYTPGKPVHLKRLDRTLKISKTRNSSKTESRIRQWKAQGLLSEPETTAAVVTPKTRPTTASKRAAQKAPQKLVRAPPKKQEHLQDVIIDEADFDGLNSGTEDGFPEIDLDDNKDDTNDDFKELEDELAQVMGLPQSEESDADDFPALLTTTPVIIDEKKPAVDQQRSTRTQSRPMSMREWVHKGVDSSSEAE